jgi:hypothetical protein
VGQETHLTLDIDGTGAFTLVELVYENRSATTPAATAAAAAGWMWPGFTCPWAVPPR